MRAAIVAAVLLGPLPQAADGQIGAGGRLLIVAADSLIPAVRALADWRTATGQQAALVPLSQAGSSPSAVRTFIRNAWNNWPVKPEYVLLFCSPAKLEGYNSINDCYYGDMTGDWRMELPVGRLPAWNAAEARAIVAKTLAYERLSDWTDTTWLLRGSTTVQEGNPGNPDSFYLPDCYFAHGLWLANGYSRADTFYSVNGHNSSDLNNALNQGRAFITYRGSASGYWYSPFDMFRPGYYWRNRFRTPILVAGTCATVTLAADEEMLADRSVRFGSEETLGGALAYFGTSRSASQVSKYRSACYRGFFHGLFADSLTELDPATVRARRWLDSLFPVQNRYQEWTLIGDPCLRVWTGLPRPLAAAYAPRTRTGPQQFTVRVESAGSPVAGASVCLWLDSTVYGLDTTDGTGSAVLSINPDHPGRMRVTVTGRNCIPWEGTCEVHVTGGPFVVHLRHLVLDSFPAGNSDGRVGAGETIAVPTWLWNMGDSTATRVRAWLRATDSCVTFLDSVREVGTVGAHDSVFAGAFRFFVDPACPDGRVLGFRLHAADSAGRTWNSDFSETVATVVLSFVGDTVRDSSGNRNGRLDPNETADLIVTLANSGSAVSRQTSAVLRSSDPRLRVLDSIGTWGDIPGHGVRDNNGDRFTLHADMMVPSTPIVCTLLVSSLHYSARSVFVISPGVLGRNDPCCDGPRIPAWYWAYDDVDSGYGERPRFEWVEARGSGTNLQLHDNQTVQLDLPAGFGPFKYYGRSYARLSVCSNGWVAPGATSFIGWENFRLPRGLEPPVLAAAWDDLVPDTARNVLWMFDSVGHRLVIEWDSVAYRSPPGRRDKFEIVIYDTTLAAADGNNEFDFQYLTSNNLQYSTVGVQDPTDTVGINVACNATYNRAAAFLLARRCIRFTSDPPVISLAEEHPTPARSLPTPAATLVRGVLFLGAGTVPERGLSRALLLDAAGRKVMALRPGPNDISALPAGVYFVLSTLDNRQSKMTKVVIQK